MTVEPQEEASVFSRSRNSSTSSFNSNKNCSSEGNRILKIHYYKINLAKRLKLDSLNPSASKNSSDKLSNNIEEKLFRTLSSTHFKIKSNFFFFENF